MVLSSGSPGTIYTHCGKGERMATTQKIVPIHVAHTRKVAYYSVYTVNPFNHATLGTKVSSVYVASFQGSRCTMYTNN